MSKYALTAMIGALALSATVLIAASSPKPSKLTVLISAQASAPSPNACAGVTYPLKCPSLNCQCVMYTGSFNGTLGHGNLSSMKLTVDGGDATPGTNCTPAFGVISFPAGNRFGAITLDVAGALCNSTPPGGKDTIGGGFDVDPTTSGIVGTGAMSGTQTGNAARIKLSGFLAPSGGGMAPTSSASATSTATSTSSPSATATSTSGLPLGL